VVDADERRATSAMRRRGRAGAEEGAARDDAGEHDEDDEWPHASKVPEAWLVRKTLFRPSPG